MRIRFESDSNNDLSLKRCLTSWHQETLLDHQFLFSELCLMTSLEICLTVPSPLWNSLVESSSDDAREHDDEGERT